MKPYQEFDQPGVHSNPPPSFFTFSCVTSQTVVHWPCQLVTCHFTMSRKPHKTRTTQKKRTNSLSFFLVHYSNLSRSWIAVQLHVMLIVFSIPSFFSFSIHNVTFFMRTFIGFFMFLTTSFLSSFYSST